MKYNYNLNQVSSFLSVNLKCVRSSVSNQWFDVNGLLLVYTSTMWFTKTTSIEINVRPLTEYKHNWKFSKTKLFAQSPPRTGTDFTYKQHWILGWWEKFGCNIDYSMVAGVFNSLQPSYFMWRYRPGSTLFRVMACCLTTTSHSPNQCWPIINKAWWHSVEGNVTEDVTDITYCKVFECYIFENTATSHRSQKLMHLFNTITTTSMITLHRFWNISDANQAVQDCLIFL